jgi:hypothetical protein
MALLGFSSQFSCFSVLPVVLAHGTHLVIWPGKVLPQAQFKSGKSEIIHGGSDEQAGPLPLFRIPNFCGS